MVASGPLGLFAYGLLNRLLLVTGLHHILNNIAWFLLGDYGGATGDLKRFFAGDPSAGAFMAGFFPVMMFGLPAACLAMYRAAPPVRRQGVAGLYLSLALTSFLTGVTEPIEFSFLFLAPVLFAIHAVLTGAAMVVMDLLGVKLGFGFSAGLLDYVLNYGLATRPLLLVPVGLGYGAIYYLAFGWAIRRLDLKTPGREPAPVEEAGAETGDRPRAIVAALGGASNLVEVDACTTRLRLVVRDAAGVDRAKLAALGARGVVDLGRGRVQVVVGPEADQLATAIRPLVGVGGAAEAPHEPAPPASAPDIALVAALRGAGVRTATARGRRLILSPAPDALPASLPGVRAVHRSGGAVHLLLEDDAEPVARVL